MAQEKEGIWTVKEDRLSDKSTWKGNTYLSKASKSD